MHRSIFFSEIGKREIQYLHARLGRMLRTSGPVEGLKCIKSDIKIIPDIQEVPCRCDIS